MNKTIIISVGAFLAAISIFWILYGALFSSGDLLCTQMHAIKNDPHLAQIIKREAKIIADLYPKLTPEEQSTLRARSLAANGLSVPYDFSWKEVGFSEAADLTRVRMSTLSEQNVNGWIEIGFGYRYGLIVSLNKSGQPLTETNIEVRCDNS